MTVAGDVPRTATSGLARAFPWVTGIVGLSIAVPAAMHMVAVTRVAYGQRSGYDPRLAELLWIGWTSLVCGLLMVAAARALRRGSSVAFRVCVGAAAVFGVCSGLLAPVSPGFLIGLPIYGGYLLLAAVVRAEVTVQPPG